MNPIRVLIVDDETFMRDSLSALLTHEGFQTAQAGSVVEALELLGRERIDAVVTDLRMPGKDGLALLRDARHGGVAAPIVMMTGVGTLAEAVKAMKEGAYDFLQKPVDPASLVRAVRRAAEHRALVSQVRSLRGRLGEIASSRTLIGTSAAMNKLRALVAQLAASDLTVLVSGESGTGKELVAWSIHAGSSRAEKPYARIDCAALAAGDFEVELFGCTRAPERPERDGRISDAEGGTLVLDEVGALEPRSQARLLRFLESGEVQRVGEGRVQRVDVRVIAITNEDLGARVKDASFRADLFHRLAVFPLTLPPLRAHVEDLPQLAEHLLLRASERRPFGNAPGKLSREALDVLGRYDWPGNVRELANVLERAQILSQGRELDAALFEGLLEIPMAAPRSAPGPAELHLRRNLDAVEKEIVQRALATSGGKKKEAANMLGIDPRNLGYYLPESTGCRMREGGRVAQPSRGARANCQERGRLLVSEFKCAELDGSKRQLASRVARTSAPEDPT